MILLGGYVAWGFPEQWVVLPRTRRSSVVILGQGMNLRACSPELRKISVATVSVNGAACAARLHPKRLREIGFPTVPDPIIWLSGLGILTLLIEAVTLWSVGRRIVRQEAGRNYAAASTLGVVGFAAAIELVSGGVATVVLAGIAISRTRLTRPEIRSLILWASAPGT